MADKKKGIVETVTDAAKGAAGAVAGAAAKLVGGDDAIENADEFAERAEAHRAKVADAANRADHEVAQERMVARFADMPEHAEFELRFATDEAFLEGAIPVGTNLKSDSTGTGQMLYTAPVDFEPEAEAAIVTEAWLIASSGETRRCEITPGLPTGAGRLARIPAGNLIF